MVGAAVAEILYGERFRRLARGARTGRLTGHGFASPKMKLPFPSIAVGADDETQRLGIEWGSRLIDGPILTAASAPTNRFRAIIERFTAAVVERDVGAAYRILNAIGDD